jgi:Tfp pilus assembly protein PilF
VSRASRAGPRDRTAAAQLTGSFVDRSTLALRVACSGPVTLDTLRALDALLDAHPGAVDLRFARACLLEDLGRLAAAERAYADLLARDPRHRGALTNAATMAYVAGRITEARGHYERAAAADPDDAVAQLNLGHVLADLGEDAASRACYERALAREPDHPIAHYALARLLDEHDDAAAAAHRGRAFATPIVHVTPSSSAAPLRVLVPIAADGGNLVATTFFDERRVETTTIVAESFRDGSALPPHDVVFNAVADADRSAEALDAVERIVAASGRPALNPPGAVRATGRVAMATRLAPIAGVVVPRIVRVGRDALRADALAAAGFRYPLLLRAPGFHAGRHLVRVHAADELGAQAERLPGDDVFVISFVDTRDADGFFRKYRMLAIDGALVPLERALLQRRQRGACRKPCRRSRVSARSARGAGRTRVRRARTRARCAPARLRRHRLRPRRRRQRGRLRSERVVRHLSARRRRDRALSRSGGRRRDRGRACDDRDARVTRRALSGDALVREDGALDHERDLGPA